MSFNGRPYKLNCAATTNATVVRASKARLINVHCTSLDATPVYLKLYNKATTPDENDTPVKVIMIPANLTAANGDGTNLIGLNSLFETGLSFRVTTGIADNNTGAVSASEVIINLDVD